MFDCENFSFFFCSLQKCSESNAMISMDIQQNTIVCVIVVHFFNKIVCKWTIGSNTMIKRKWNKNFVCFGCFSKGKYKNTKILHRMCLRTEEKIIKINLNICCKFETINQRHTEIYVCERLKKKRNKCTWNRYDCVCFFVLVENFKILLVLWLAWFYSLLRTSNSNGKQF